MTHPIVQFALPALFVGIIAGYYAVPALSPSVSVGDQASKDTPSCAPSLSSTEEPIDYNKVARVCFAASRQESARRSSHAVSKVAEVKELDPVERERLKTGLDDVMSISLENGVWSSGAGLRARGILGHLSPADAAEFENLLSTTVRRGDLQVEPGAWTPGS